MSAPPILTAEERRQLRLSFPPTPLPAELHTPSVFPGPSVMLGQTHSDPAPGRNSALRSLFTPGILQDIPDDLIGVPHGFDLPACYDYFSGRPETDTYGSSRYKRPAPRNSSSPNASSCRSSASPFGQPPYHSKREQDWAEQSSTLKSPSSQVSPRRRSSAGRVRKVLMRLFPRTMGVQDDIEIDEDATPPPTEELVVLGIPIRAGSFAFFEWLTSLLLVLCAFVLASPFLVVGMVTSLPRVGRRVILRQGKKANLQEGKVQEKEDDHQTGPPGYEDEGRPFYPEEFGLTNSGI